MADFDTTPVPNYGQQMRLDGKVFVVLGAGAGMGRQTAHALSQMGAKVVCVGRSKEATERVAKEVGGVALLGDMTKREDAETVFQQVESTFGRLDGVADILGVNSPVKFMDTREEDWVSQLQQGVLHAVYAIQLGAPLIAKSGGGSITLVGSLGGLTPTAGSMHYSAAKAALHHVTKLSGVAFGPQNVRINCVVPGLTATPKLQKILNEEAFAKMAEPFPLRKPAQSSDIANAILFLASDMARSVTSQLLIVDNGASAGAA